MQTAAEHLTMDFETHPVGTGKELARLSDEAQATNSAFELVRQHGFAEAQRLCEQWRDNSAQGTATFALHNAVCKKLREFATVGAAFRTCK